MRYFALLSAQGTACAETVLTEDEYNDPVRRRAADSRARHTAGRDAPIPGTWTDVTDNDAISPELAAPRERTNVSARLDETDLTHKIINAEDARTDLVDALADLAHVLRHEGVDGDSEPSDEVVEFALGVEIANAVPSAMLHYRAEQAGEDGTRITIEGVE